MSRRGRPVAARPVTDVDLGEAHLAGAALSLVLPFALALGAVSANGGYATAAFWSAPRDRKLDHIARHRREWIAMHVGWVAMLAVATGGLVAFGVLLARGPASRRSRGSASAWSCSGC